MQGRARFAWRSTTGRIRPCPAPRWRVTGCARGWTLPHEPTAPLKPATGPSFVPFNWVAPPKPDKLLEGFCPDPGAEARIAVNSNGLMLFLRLDDIEWVEAADDSVELHVEQQTYPVRSSLAALAAKLPPNRFFRLSPWTLVNIKQISELRANLQGEYEVRLRNGTRLALIRQHSSNLRQSGCSLSSSINSVNGGRFCWRQSR